MATNKHIIDIQTKGAKKSEKQVKGVSGALGGLAKQAGIAAAAYFGSRMLLDGLKQSIDLFAKQELAEKKLRFAAGSSTNELIRQAQALQQTTRFGDEALIAQQAYVKSLGISTEQTKEIIAASVDLAAAMGISLESAVMNTTKTLSGMQGELGEKLPAAFKELTAEQLKAGEGIVFIREQFRGTATEETKTMTGALDQMSNAIGDAGEAFGELLAPMVIATANAIKSAAEVFEDLFSWQDKYNALAQETIGIMTKLEIHTKEYSEALDDMSVHQLAAEFTKLTNAQTTLSLETIQSKIKSGELNDMLSNSVPIIEGATGGIGSFTTNMGASGTATEFMSAELKELIEHIRDFNIVNEQSIDDYADWEANQLNKHDAMEMELSFRDAFIEKHRDEAEALGFVMSVEEQREAKRKKAVNTTLSGLKTLENASRKNKETYQGLQAAITLADTHSAAVAQFKEFSKSYPAPIGQILGTAAYASAMAMGLKSVEGIKAAQYGADYVTSGPELIMVGDNPSGREHIQVTPLGGDPNINGPQGGGITLNISGNVMSDEFTEDIIVPRLQEALRLGNTL